MSSIPEFFAGKNIFVTGATGFMGKALIEKLLRSCPAIGNIYILMRPKRGKNLQERLDVLINDQLYERVKRERPDLKMNEKIIPLSGDMSEISLGLSPKDRKILITNVNIVFHVAASVRFDDPLKDAVLLNVRGTREVCLLVLEMKNLAVHVHVSTAFANCDRSEATEQLYPAKCDWRKLIQIAERFSAPQLAALTDKLLGDMPNTYCYTKNIAEHVVVALCGGRVPVKLFRPSIVVSSMRAEPIAGWIDNFNGPVGLLVAYGKGILRTTYAHIEYKPDYIPVDVVTKALIVSAWDLAVRRQHSHVEVIQCTSHNVADWLRLNAKQTATIATAINKQIPLNDVIWTPSSHTTNSTLVWYIRTILFMLVPSLLVDLLLKITGHKPRLVKLQRKMYVAQLALRHFMTNEWVYHNDNLLALQTKIQTCDAPDWDYEFRVNDPEEYVRHCIIGCRRYLLREPDDTLPKARRHFVRMRRIHRALQIAFGALVVWMLYQRFEHYLN